MSIFERMRLTSCKAGFRCGRSGIRAGQEIQEILVSDEVMRGVREGFENCKRCPCFVREMLACRVDVCITIEIGPPAAESTRDLRFTKDGTSLLLARSSPPNYARSSIERHQRHRWWSPSSLCILRHLVRMHYRWGF